MRVHHVSQRVPAPASTCCHIAMNYLLQTLASPTHFRASWKHHNDLCTKSCTQTSYDPFTVLRTLHKNALKCSWGDSVVVCHGIKVKWFIFFFYVECLPGFLWQVNGLKLRHEQVFFFSSPFFKLGGVGQKVLENNLSRLLWEFYNPYLWLFGVHLLPLPFLCFFFFLFISPTLDSTLLLVSLTFCLVAWHYWKWL